MNKRREQGPFNNDTKTHQTTFHVNSFDDLHRHYEENSKLPLPIIIKIYTQRLRRIHAGQLRISM